MLDKLYFKEVFERAESRDIITLRTQHERVYVICIQYMKRRRIYSYMRRDEKRDEQGNVFMKTQNFNFGKREANIIRI